MSHKGVSVDLRYTATSFEIKTTTEGALPSSYMSSLNKSLEEMERPSSAKFGSESDKDIKEQTLNVFKDK